MSPQRYERFVGSLYRRLLASAAGSTQPDEIHHRSRYRGLGTHNMHQIDLSYRFTRRQRSMLVLVECKCKCYRRNVEKAVVEQLHTKMGDIKAPAAIVVTTKGFQKGAIRAAKAYGIALYVARLRSPLARSTLAQPLPAKFEIVLGSRGHLLSRLPRPAGPPQGRS